MSIYCTLWTMKLEYHGPDARSDWPPDFVTISAQAVPPHIGHPADYPDGDPYAAFLPPVVESWDPQGEYEDSGLDGSRSNWRAVFIVQEGYQRKDVQRYVEPLLMLTAAEYRNASFVDLLDRIEQAIRPPAGADVRQLRPDLH
jgi:hypothetical protein